MMGLKYKVDFPACMAESPEHNYYHMGRINIEEISYPDKKVTITKYSI